MARPRKNPGPNIQRTDGPKIISPQAGFQERFVRSNVDCAFGGGVLNPQPITSHILTPSGFRQLSEVKTGDEILGLQNEIQHITHCDNEGFKDCIRVVLEDGSSAESALDHKWWVLKDGQEMTAISFELLESFQISQEKNIPYEVFIFRYLDGKPVPVKILRIEDIGKKEVVCLGVSNDDELYITDDYLITKNCGKAQPYSAQVLTPTGYVTIGSLKEGDIILDPRGNRQKVLRIYEKGYRPIYELQLDYGSIRCTGDHLWRVFDVETKTYRTMTLLEMMDSMIRKFSIPCCLPLDFECECGERLVDPYVLGKVIAIGFVDRELISPNLEGNLYAMGLSEHNFFVPQSYLYAPLSVRQEVMKGIIDGLTVLAGTGRFMKRVHLEESALPSVADLAASLGGYVSTVKSQKKGVNCEIWLPNLEDYLADTVKVQVNRKLIPLRRIRGVRKVGVERARCILVSSPSHLYITDHFTITHNTFAAILMVAEPSLDPRFRGAFTRRNLGNLKQGGGIVDDFSVAYGDYINTTTSDNPRITFASGAYVDCLHIADEEPGKLMERAKGWQYDLFYLDELTSYEFTTFSIVGTRCRGKASWTGKIRGTTNPKRSHWTRRMLDWYIGPDGFVIPERDGVVTYYYQNGDTVEDIVHGLTKEEVYRVCKVDIDKKLSKLGGEEWTYKDMIRSFVFYAGKMSENKASIGTNSSYIGAVAAVGGKRAQQLVEGNFNVDEDESDEAPISGHLAQRVFMNDPCVNGDRWITVDLADVGTDNVLALSWNGLHVDDAMIIKSSTPRMNYEKLRLFANKHNVGEGHIIYDATHAAYMLDYMPEAIAFVSASSSRGLYATACDRLKDECYVRLIDVINNGRMSFSDEVATRIYQHQNLKAEVTFQAEFLAECAVVRLRETNSGKKKLWNKKEMNAMLGNHRSMDLLDPCAMRMYPLLSYQYGDELSMSAQYQEETEYQEDTDQSIYDDTLWS